jgi:hypothetical protein
MASSRISNLIAASAVLGFITYLFSSLNPTNYLGLTVLYVVPIGFVFMTIAILPERKGQLWPHGNARFTRGVLLQVWWSLVLLLWVFVWGCATTYGLIFPNTVYPVHPSWLIPNPTGFYVLVGSTAFMGFAFLFQLWRFIQMLPPKR